MRKFPVQFFRLLITNVAGFFGSIKKSESAFFSFVADVCFPFPILFVPRDTFKSRSVVNLFSTVSSILTGVRNSQILSLVMKPVFIPMVALNFWIAQIQNKTVHVNPSAINARPGIKSFSVSVFLQIPTVVAHSFKIIVGNLREHVGVFFGRNWNQFHHHPLTSFSGVV